jgi:hypothetical protein
MFNRIAVFTFAALLTTSLHAAPFKGADVSSDAKWVMHADIEQLRGTELGKFILEKLNADDISNKIAAFSAVFGFDPRKDVDSVTLYGKSEKPDQAVAVIGGKIGADQLVTLLKANSTYESQTYGNYTIHSWIDEKKPYEGRQFGVVHGGGKLLISRGAPMLQEALDVLDSKHAVIDPATVLGKSLLAQAPFVVLGADLNAARAAQGEDTHENEMMKNVNSAQLGLGERDGSFRFDVTLSAKDEPSAAGLQQVVQGFLAMAAMGAEQNPEFAQLAQQVKTSLDGQTLSLNLAYPVKQMIDLMEKGMARKKAEAQAMDADMAPGAPQAGEAPPAPQPDVEKPAAPANPM